MKATLTRDQIDDIKSMNDYWEEICKRENAETVSLTELYRLSSYISPILMLLIVGEYAKNYKSE